MTDNNKRWAEESPMVAFQLIGMTLVFLFFGAIVTGDPDISRH
jgi:hypothetical protein